MAVVLYNVCTGILQAVGDSKHPLYYLIVSSCTNIVLDIIFCGVFRLGVAYAALATVISQFISAGLIVRCLMREQAPYRLFLKNIHLHTKYVGKILQIGLPAGLQGTVFSLSNVVIQSSINSFGEVVMSGNAAALNIEGFMFELKGLKNASALKIK